MGRASLAYDMWGSAVDLAYRAQSGSPQTGIYVTGRVFEATRGVRQFAEAGTVTVDGTDATIWRLVERQT